MRRTLLLAFMVMLGTNALAAAPAPHAGVKVKRPGEEPTQFAQSFIYLLNKARHDPPAYGKSINLNLDNVAATPPLAPSKELSASAHFRTTDMLKRNFYGHVDPDGCGPNLHALESGYPLGRGYGRKKSDNNIESIFGGNQTPAEALQQLIVDHGVPSLGHRKHLLGMASIFAVAREIGASLESPENGNALAMPRGAVHTARTDQPEAFVTGVVYEDKNDNGAYDDGEGLAGVTIVSGGGNSTQSMAFGGFALPVKAGAVIVGCHKGPFKDQATAKIVMDDRNVHVEFVSGKKEGILNFGKPIPPKKTGPQRR